MVCVSFAILVFLGHTDSGDTGPRTGLRMCHV